MSCQFVVTTLLLTCGLVSSTAGQQELSAISDDVYRLRLFHAHTGEHLDIVYRNATDTIRMPTFASTVICATTGPAQFTSATLECSTCSTT
jgi:hypothetical protein